MALVVETGSGDNASANSYADLTFIRAFNTARGRALSDDDDVVTAQAIQAMDFIEAQEAEMKGSRTFEGQPLSFPRNDVTLPGGPVDDDFIPVQLKNAQAELIWQIKSGVVLFPTISGDAQLKRRKTGPLEKEWFPGGGGAPELLSVSIWLDMFLTGWNGQLKVVRV